MTWRLVGLVVLLALSAAAQIGGYFKLGPVPSSVVEGGSFTVGVSLETTARQDLKLAIETINLHAPAEVIIAKGQKTATFEVKVGHFSRDVRVDARPVWGRLVVSSGKSRQERDISILPLRTY